MYAKMQEFLDLAKQRAEESEGKPYEWNYRECKYNLMDFAESRFDRLGYDDIIDEFESLNGRD